jgi:hypothetical protein
MIKLGLHLG